MGTRWKGLGASSTARPTASVFDPSTSGRRHGEHRWNLLGQRIVGVGHARLSLIHLLHNGYVCPGVELVGLPVRDHDVWLDVCHDVLDVLIPWSLVVHSLVGPEILPR